MTQDKKQTYGTLEIFSINRSIDLPMNENIPTVHSETGNGAFQHPENPELHFLPVQEYNKELKKKNRKNNINAKQKSITEWNKSKDLKTILWLALSYNFNIYCKLIHLQHRI